MNSSILLKKIKRNKEDYGLLTVVKKILLTFLAPVYEKKIYRIYKIDLNDFKSLQKNTFCSYNVRIITPKDTKMITEIEDMAEWLHGHLYSIIEKGGLCFGSFNGKHLIGFNLILFGDVFIPLVKFKKHFQEHEAWSAQISVYRDYRRKGVATDLRYQVFHELKIRGIKNLYGGCLIENLPNLWLTRKVGFREIGNIYYLKLFFIKKWDYKRIENDLF